MVGSHVVVVRGAGLQSMAASQRLPVKQLCDYSGSDAKNKQNRVKYVLGSERCLIFVCASAKNIIWVLRQTLCVFVFVCVCVFVLCLRLWLFAQNQHVLWLIRPEHGNYEWLQMLNGWRFIFFYFTLLSEPSAGPSYLTLPRVYSGISDFTLYVNFMLQLD